MKFRGIESIEHKKEEEKKGSSQDTKQIESSKIDAPSKNVESAP